MTQQETLSWLREDEAKWYLHSFEKVGDELLQDYGPIRKLIAAYENLAECRREMSRKQFHNEQGPGPGSYSIICCINCGCLAEKNCDADCSWSRQLAGLPRRIK